MTVPDALASADVRRAVLAGESAGGTLTFALAQQCRDRGLLVPAAQISMYGTATMQVTNPEFETVLLSPADCHRFWDLHVPILPSATHRTSTRLLRPI